ncbi:aquaporin family protein [Phycicoccus sp. CSK15P-2]|uniref:MIP/aquaporin family protein n=1 Tax=Phycicoccus sp. CSK15P-2 TaxID=2807627 RepID=UPI00194F0769|nr:MIP/aquaporin family protein [Phycicoccus sp. CSK15P-2]MBM6403023.1 aquaporin family protein [Phycicoccus sp. CSK15P-2]
MTDIFIPEAIGTATLLLFGVGVVANAVLPKTTGNGGGFLMINFGWGIGVFAGVYVAYRSGAHINPAVTLGLVASGDDLGGDTAVKVLLYLTAQMVGAVLGATLAWLAYRRHFDAAEAPEDQLACFSTGPGIPSTAWNVVTEVIGTFVLVFVVIAFGKTPSGLGPLAVSLLVVGIGASLGGPTGYAINPARDLGPRIAHALLPMKGKGSSNWGYAWVPVVGPAIGGVLGGFAAHALAFA